MWIESGETLHRNQNKNRTHEVACVSQRHLINELCNTTNLEPHAGLQETFVTLFLCWSGSGPVHRGVGKPLSKDSSLARRGFRTVCCRSVQTECLVAVVPFLRMGSSKVIVSEQLFFAAGSSELFFSSCKQTNILFLQASCSRRRIW